ncbi:MAG: EAL domain-containing protein [Ruminococcus sp.]|nr:EAL domain-containing protein [Ruminococcus sp.]
MAMQNITEKEIRLAIENDELVVYYQPQYDALTGKLMSAEALVRWVRDGEVILPGEFIPLAEQSNLIRDIDWYVLEKVCVFLRKELEQGVSLRIAVNFSRKHLDEENLISRLCQTVDKYSLPHELIEIELTESAIMQDISSIVEIVNEIRENGFNVAIDDFGSGLSSLSLVKDVSANVLKIDRSLLSGNCENEKERIVLESIFTFAHRLKLTTVAEGVETREQLGFLRTCDCRMIQGFLFARPMPEEDFAKLSSQPESAQTEDILLTQPQTSVTNLLMEAIFYKYPLVIMANLTRNSFYMMAYDNFSSKSCPSTGVFEELIEHGASTMHPDDKESFKRTFSINSLTDAYNRAEKSVTLVTRQMGDDGIYRRVETTDIFVKNPSVDDLLVITLCQNLED